MGSAGNSLAMIAGALLASFLIVGGVGWVIRRFWRSAAGAAFIPAGFHAVIQVKNAAIDPNQMNYALISVLMGVIWWGLFARANSKRDAKLRREAEEQRQRGHD